MLNLCHCVHNKYNSTNPQLALYLIKALRIVYLIISKTWVNSKNFDSLYNKVDMCYKVFCGIKMLRNI